jgi:hypothetical protein
MPFWTLETNQGPVTLCDDCALIGTNAGTPANEQFGSMDEAALILHTMSAMASVELGLTSSPTGACENCYKRMEVIA